MRYSSQIKPISYLKANAAAVLDHLNEVREPMVITQNGEARAVLVDVHSYEKTQESLALLKLMALAEADYREGRMMPLAQAFEEIDRELDALELRINA